MRGSLEIRPICCTFIEGFPYISYTDTQHITSLAAAASPLPPLSRVTTTTVLDVTTAAASVTC